MAAFKKIGVALSSSALALSLLATSAVASEEKTGQGIEAAALQTVTKNELVAAFKKLFPEFDYLAAADFQMSSGTSVREGEKRYYLSFSRAKQGKQVSGSASFTGKDLLLDQYYYYSPHEADALFPAKVSNDEARKIAEAFVSKVAGDKSYKMQEAPFTYNVKLTEPVRYSFTFNQMKDNVPVYDRNLHVTVLGNGEVVDYYNFNEGKNDVTFDKVGGSQEKTKVLEQVKKNLAVDLQYEVNWNYQTGDRKVDLVYTPRVSNVHALTGKWETVTGFLEQPSAKPKIEMITSKPLAPKDSDMTAEKAQKFAEQFLKPASDDVKLTIESIDERTNYNGQEVISIYFSYKNGNRYYGSSLEIDKQTGDLLNYYEAKEYHGYYGDEKPDFGDVISEQEALKAAAGYMKDLAPSRLHLYAKPLQESRFDEMSGAYQFTFPRVEKGLTVIGDQIFVSVNADGTLNGLNADSGTISEWPDPSKAIGEAEALAKLKEKLSVDLTYVRKGDAKHYDLVYMPSFGEHIFGSIDARTGEWKSGYGVRNDVKVTHPWAEEELNYLISNNLLDVKDGKTFNGDSAITKGEALRVVMSSLTYFYDGRFGGPEQAGQTFENIDPAHSLYTAVEHAAAIGLIDASQKTFDTDAPLTKQELAVWYIRILGLEQAAEHPAVFKADFADADLIKKENIGYVALANAKGLLTAADGRFDPGKEISYADLAVSTIRLAHQLAAKKQNIYY